VINKKPIEDDFKVQIHPQKLHGINMFWKYILEPKDTKVVANSIDMLNKLYIKLSDETMQQLLIIRAD